MKVLVIGASGFVGSNVLKSFSSKHSVYGASRIPKKGTVIIDLTKPETISTALRKIEPDVIIQCAGIVENTEAAYTNPIFTKNLLDQVVASGVKPKRIIICGSAAEYGEVTQQDLPVKENARLKPTSPYRKSKIEETNIALNFRNSHKLPIVIARIFNPIGPNMQSNFLSSRILVQIDEFKAGLRENIEVSRLDSLRDYIDVRDLARGIQSIAEGNPTYYIYNIGSGRATSNGELVELMLDLSELNNRPRVVETAAEPEPLLACQADISRMQQDFDWKPSVTLEDTVKGIIDAAS